MTKSTPNPNTFCKLSHISLAVQNEGDICACHLSSESLKSNQTKEVIKIHVDGLDAAWNSFSRKIITTALDRGVKLPSCKQCWQTEESGRQSVRQIMNDVFKDVDISKEQPRVLIIKPGNVCNLGCRMCQPSTSTSLYQDFYNVDTERKSFNGNFKDYTKLFEDIRIGFRSDNDLIWGPINRWWSGLKFVDIYGGEPMLAPAFWDSAKNAVDQDVAKDIALQLHTNGTIWNEKYIDILTKFKSVELRISIDSHIKEHLEYIRHKADYDVVFGNLKRYIDLAKKHNTINLGITLTVTSYNVYYVDEALKNLEEYGLPIGVNLVAQPEHYDIRHLPVTVKNSLLTQVKHPTLKDALAHTIPGCDIQWPKFCEEVVILDRIRNQSFSDTFPEWYEILKPYFRDGR